VTVAAALFRRGRPSDETATFAGLSERFEWGVAVGPDERLVARALARRAWPVGRKQSSARQDRPRLVVRKVFSACSRYYGERRLRRSGLASAQPRPAPLARPIDEAHSFASRLSD
jgi:hypothetical protein